MTAVFFSAKAGVRDKAYPSHFQFLNCEVSDLLDIFFFEYLVAVVMFLHLHSDLIDSGLELR